MKPFFGKVVDLIPAIFRKPKSIPIEELRFYSLLKVVNGLAWITHFSWIILFLVLGVKELAYFNILSVATFSFAQYLNRKRRYFASIATGTYEVIAHQVLCVAMIGIESGFQYFILLAAMLSFLLPRGKRWVKTLLLMSNLAGFLIINYLIANQPPLYSLSPEINFWLGFINIIVTFVFFGIFGLYFASAMLDTEEKLNLEREKSDHLLNNILPQSIANRLKVDPHLIAEDFESVSVLFADIAGFTKWTERLSPEDLVSHLNEVFSEFDALTEKYHLEKIKTIGDAYMVSGGLPDHIPHHAAKIADMALEMMDYMQRRRKQTKEDLEIRVGIHIGPAVAGVIGVKKFAYDLWGDTVNTASRMESHGVPGKIQVSPEFYDLLKDHYHFEAREPIQIKGKGLMQTYFLIKKK